MPELKALFPNQVRFPAILGFWGDFSQSVSLTQCVVLSVCLSVRQSVRLFQLTSESLCDVVARRRSDYCPCGAIFESSLIGKPFCTLITTTQIPRNHLAVSDLIGSLGNIKQVTTVKVTFVNPGPPWRKQDKHDTRIITIKSKPHYSGFILLL